MGAIFSKNGRRHRHESTQLAPTGMNSGPSNGSLRRRTQINQTPNAPIQSIFTPDPSSAQNAQRNRPLYLDTERAGRKMVLRSVPINNQAQLLDLLSRAKTLYMDWKRRKQIIRRRRARRAVNFGFLGLRFAIGVIGLGGLFGFEAPHVPLLNGVDVDPEIEFEDDNGLEEDYDEDDNCEIPVDGVYEASDQQAQTGGHDVDNDPSIPSEVQAAFFAANILGAMTAAGQAARQDLAANWKVRTLRANIGKLRRHTAEEILPYLPAHHGIDISWVKVKA